MIRAAVGCGFVQLTTSFLFPVRNYVYLFFKITLKPLSNSIFDDTDFAEILSMKNKNLI